MMLTGPAIRAAIAAREIEIDPYVPEHVGPNSIDLTLANELLTYVPQFRGDFPKPLDARADNPVERREFEITTLRPGILYLARSVERIHSDLYASTIHGRSSVGRLGVVVHQTAAFIDVGFDGVVTLEITVTHPVRLYAGMRIAQVAFHPLAGEIELYRGKYQGAREVQASRLHQDSDIMGRK